MPYSQKFKLRMIKLLSSPGGPSATKLSREVGVSQATLSRWLLQARTLPAMSTGDDAKPTPPDGKLPRTPRSWTAEEKYRLVVEAAAVPESELGEFLRKEGVHAAQLEEWRTVAAEGAQAALGTPKKPSRKKAQGEAKRLRALERELNRKDKALAEMAALIALKKKADLLWGGGDESTPTKNGS